MSKDILPLNHSFHKSSFEDFEKDHPALVKAFKNWKFDQSVRDEANVLSALSPYNKIMVGLYIAKYAPEGTKAKGYSVDTMRDFYATLYSEEGTPVPADVRDEIQDLIGDFLVDNKAAFEEFSAQIRAWDISESAWRRVRRDAGSDEDNVLDLG